MSLSSRSPPELASPARRTISRAQRQGSNAAASCMRHGTDRAAPELRCHAGVQFMRGRASFGRAAIINICRVPSVKARRAVDYRRIVGDLSRSLARSLERAAERDKEGRRDGAAQRNRRCASADEYRCPRTGAPELVCMCNFVPGSCVRRRCGPAMTGVCRGMRERGAERALVSPCTGRGGFLRSI